MNRFCLIIAVLGFSVGIQGCKNKGANPVLTNRDVGRMIKRMSDIMVHDVTNPPLAARFFAYTCLAGYEVVAENDKNFKNFHGVLNEYPLISKPSQLSNYDYRLTAILAMMKTAGKLQPSGSLMINFEKNFLDSCRNAGFKDETIDSSRHYAEIISKKILAYAKKDKYNRISNYPRYKLKTEAGSWKPTPPAYLIPVEPYFNTIRTLTLDSASQFTSAPPIPFSTNKHSAFYKILLLNYAKSDKGLTQQQKDIANFWDCNPFNVQNEGHMLIGLKKISPGAHWMGIANMACRQAKTSFSKTIEINTAVAIGLLDAFICCWDDKYSTNRIRPETVIREYIDPNWKPLLQTPPFPEYTSGHSVISAASATILTHYLGDNHHYTDSVEVDFGIPPRKFRSFNLAANEAGISRFWGGIHFMDAVNNGILQGKKVGNHVIEKINQAKH